MGTMSYPSNLTGYRFGKLLVIAKGKTVKRNGYRSGTRVYWECVCDCGSKKEVVRDSLIKGQTLSCGCLRTEELIKRVKTHGMSNSKLYRVWHSMIERCQSKTNKNYQDYGGRGIKVCEKWLEFNIFMNWAVKSGYKEELTIERIDVNGNYEPDNCKWITRSEQVRNKRNTIRVKHNGKTMLLVDVSKATGTPYSTLYARYLRDKNKDAV